MHDVKTDKILARVLESDLPQIIALSTDGVSLELIITNTVRPIIRKATKNENIIH